MEGWRDGVTVVIASNDNRDLTIQSFMEKPLTVSTPTSTHLLRTAYYPGQTPEGHVFLCHDIREIGDHMLVCVQCVGCVGKLHDQDGTQQGI